MKKKISVVPCAHQYCKDGFAMITEDDGLLEAWAATDEDAVVAGVPLPLDEEEIQDLMDQQE